MLVDWKLEIKDPNGKAAPDSVMSEIQSYTQPDASNEIYACGYRWDTPLDDTTSGKTATIMQMDGDGIVTILYNFGDAMASGADGKQQDSCRSVAYDYQRQEVAFMIEATSESLRPNYRNYDQYSKANNDLTIVLMRPGGILQGAFNINFWDASISLKVGQQTFFIKDDEYVFGSNTWGYKTKYQNVTYSLTAP